MLTVKVVRKTIETDDIVSLELAPIEGDDLPSFDAGAHIDVEIGPGLVRQYSLCNAPEERGRYLIGVLKETSSRGGSLAMHALEEGGRLRISTPRNHFPLESAEGFSLLLAGGIGITPILCMAEHLQRVRANFSLHYCTKSRDKTAFLRRIEDSALMPNVRFHFDNEDASQRLDLEKILHDVPSGTHIYVCGPPGFIDWALSTARRLGVPETQIHREYFAASAPLAGAADADFEIKIASSGATYLVPGDRTVLDVLRDNGLDVPASCEQGVCATCLTRVLEGVPDHRDYVLSEQERQANDVFAPCCSRAKSAVLVLDL